MQLVSGGNTRVRTGDFSSKRIDPFENQPLRRYQEEFWSGTYIYGVLAYMNRYVSVITS
jgi:hypothetical protein